MNANAKSQMNAVTGTVFTGSNEAACLSAIKEHKYTSNLWITHYQAEQNGLLAKQVWDGTKLLKTETPTELQLANAKALRGHAVGLIRFDKSNGKSTPKWYKVFNISLLNGVPATLNGTKAEAPKATKKAAKATKVATKVAAPVVETSQKPAIPVVGEPGFYLIANAAGIYSKVHVG